MYVYIYIYVTAPPGVSAGCLRPRRGNNNNNNNNNMNNNNYDNNHTINDRGQEEDRARKG